MNEVEHLEFTRSRRVCVLLDRVQKNLQPWQGCWNLLQCMSVSLLYKCWFIEKLQAEFWAIFAEPELTFILRICWWSRKLSGRETGHLELCSRWRWALAPNTHTRAVGSRCCSRRFPPAELKGSRVPAGLREGALLGAAAGSHAGTLSLILSFLFVFI